MATGRYSGKVVIITGGSKGIGAACVKEFVKNGSKVVFCARGDKDGKKIEADVNKDGSGEAFFIQCDVTKEEQIKRLVEKTVEKYGQIDCLINNAGRHPGMKPIDEISAQEFRDLFELNVMSYFLASKYALPHIRKTEGNIINTSSLVNQLGQVGTSSYAATKGAVAAFTRALAIDEAKYLVRVNTVTPGNFWTPAWEYVANLQDDPKATKQSGEKTQVLGRMGTPEEIAKLFVFIAAEGTYMTGADVINSGGAELGMGRKSRREEHANPFE